MIQKILVVDDDEDVVPLFNQMFKTELEERLFEFVFKFSAVETNDYILSVSLETILLIMLDINMPGKSGIEMLKELKKEIDIPIFIFTGYDDEINRKYAELFKADKYLPKPIDFNELRKDILNLFYKHNTKKDTN